jgi:hypothetical protein
VRGAAAQYLKKPNRIEVITMPGKAPAPATASKAGAAPAAQKGAN